MSWFFLGSRCNNCGDYKPEFTSDRYKGEWVVSFGRYVRATPFEILNPTTWFSHYKWEETT